MAMKQDTFWDKKLEKVFTQRTRSGLRVTPFNPGIEQMGLLCFSLASWAALVVIPKPVEPFMRLPLCPIFLFALSVAFYTLFPAELNRYRLFSPGARQYVADRAFLTQRSLLKFLKKNSHLLDEVDTNFQRTQWAWGNYWAFPYGRVVLYLSVICLVAAVLLPLYQDPTPAQYTARVVLLLGLTLFIVLMRRRFMPSCPQTTPIGPEMPPDERARFHFSAVTSVSLCWDVPLQRDYLRLDYARDSKRFYNFTSDPLYLIRVAKAHMPHLELRL